jgi:Helicase conserved C-terminal domain
MGTVTAATPRSLADDLRARSDDELAALLRARPDLLTPIPADIGQLASRATTRTSVLRAVDRLDRLTLHVVEALAMIAEPATPDAVQSLLGIPAASVRAAIGVLRAQALAWGQDSDLRLTRTVRELIGPQPAGLGPPLADVLSALPPGRLARLADDLGAPTVDDDALPGTLADVISDRVDVLLGELSADARSAAEKLAAGPPSGRVGDARRDVSRATARTPVDELLARGLVVPTDESTVALPREVALRLRGGVLHRHIPLVQPVPAGAGRDPATVDRTAGSGAFEAVRRVETMIESWELEPPPVLRNGGLGVRDLRRLPRLLDVDEAGAALLAEVAYAAGLVGASDDVDPVWLPTAGYDVWFREEPARRWTRLATAWLATTRTPGLVGTRDDRDRLVAPLGNDLERPLAPEVRRLVLDVLTALPAGLAAEPTDVVEAVRWHRPRRGGRLRDDLVRWTLREAEALGVTGHGALASYVRPLLDGRPADAAGKAATSALATVLPEPLDHVLIQADLTAVAPGPLRPDLARRLTSMSDVESRGGASVHRFTPDSVRRALDSGQTAAEIHEFLRKLSRTPVPQPLTYLVDDIARQHGRLRVGAAAGFLRCDDEAVISEILANPGSAALGFRRIAPTVLISALDPATLVERLRPMGYGPTPEGPDGSIVIAWSATRRAPVRPTTGQPLADRPAPAGQVLTAAVRAVRAGERSVASRPAAVAPARLTGSGAVRTLTDLRAALEHGATVWIGYVDQHGATSERVVDPIRVEGGRLTAFDHRSGEVRSFAVHRITGVAPVE